MEMAGYRRVNYYELCRLCTSSEGTKMHIFREEGRRRSLPNKIQTCLPLTVQEGDSLPKIICSGCVEKLESYFEFRESCINAEAMLESYFTSLRYSDDLSREGKVSVYVKEEPNKKKEDCNTQKAKVPTLSTASTNVNTSSPTAVNSVNVASTVQSETVAIPSAIQILTDQDGNRLAQYKVQVQGGIPSLVPSFSHVQVPVPGLQQVKTINVPQPQDGNQATQTDNGQQQPPLMAAVTLTPQPHDLFSIAGKDRYRGSLSQISEALKMKNVNVIDASLVEQLNNLGGVAGNPGVQFRIDPEHLQQLMSSGGGLQLNLNTISSVKAERREKEEQSNEDMDLKYEEEADQGLDNDTEIVDVNCEITDSDGQSFDCELCGKSFRRKEHLLQHKKSHSGQRPFACSICGKAFSRKEHLLRHKVSHTGQKLYTCDVCQKNFSRKDNLHKHKKTHGINGPHVCEICGKSFVVKHYYTIHKATHNREGKAAATTASTGTQPTQSFHCDICVKFFSSKHALEAHKQRHRNKIKVEDEISEQEQQNQQSQHQHQQQQQQQQPPQQQQQQPTIIASFPMTTINHQSLLTPNILHTAGNMVQIGNASYVCTTELLDQYRRLHSS